MLFFKVRHIHNPIIWLCRQPQRVGLLKLYTFHKHILNLELTNTKKGNRIENKRYTMYTQYIKRHFYLLRVKVPNKRNFMQKKSQSLSTLGPILEVCQKRNSSTKKNRSNSNSEGFVSIELINVRKIRIIVAERRSI